MLIEQGLAHSPHPTELTLACDHEQLQIEVASALEAGIEGGPHSWPPILVAALEQTLQRGAKFGRLLKNDKQLLRPGHRPLGQFQCPGAQLADT